MACKATAHPGSIEVYIIKDRISAPAGAQFIATKSGNLLSSKLDAELTPRCFPKSPDKSGSYITSLRVLSGLQPLSANSTRSLLRSGLPAFGTTTAYPLRVYLAIVNQRLMSPFFGDLAEWLCIVF
jgi:hypothetical protein